MDEVLEQNIPTRPNKNNKRTKIIIFTIIGLIVLIGAVLGYLKYQKVQEEKAKEEYANLMADTSVDMYAELLISSLVVTYYSDIWNSAIDNRKDFNVELANYRENIRESILDEREVEQDKLRDNMKILQNPPDDYLESYIVLKQMYGSYTKMAEQVQSPSGSLIEFNRKTNEIYSDFEKQQEEFTITLPADVKKLKEKIEAEKEDEIKDETDEL